MEEVEFTAAGSVSSDGESKPEGAVTFEEVTAGFDGKAPGGRHHTAYKSLCFAIAASLIGVCFRLAGIHLFEAVFWFCSIFYLVVFLLDRFVLFRHKIAETPYGSIYYSVFCGDLLIQFPELDYKNGKVFWNTFTYSPPSVFFNSRNTYIETYVERIKRNPVAWLKHLFYCNLEDEYLMQIKSIPNSSKELLNKLEWYNSQKGKYYNLFTQST